ncbi:MAG: L-seryl-tRNA(Sec) selenium transferase [Deltaproteobacteria bacterium]
MVDMEKKKDLLRQIPGVDELLKDPHLSAPVYEYGAGIVTEAVRKGLDELRSGVLGGSVSEVAEGGIIAMVLSNIASLTRPSLRKVINATGTIIHTNIGRAVLSTEAADAVRTAALCNTNLEFDLATGERGERDTHLEELIKRLTGAEAATVVNNNAAAVLLTLNTLAESREVIISRGELIEIGGSFRLPEIIKKSGCVMREVGTTNRTHQADYLGAITPDTALIFKAHTSNYRVVGFTAGVYLSELALLAKKHGIPVVEDLGSGSLIDLASYDLPDEPVAGESIRAGADIVTFSGDKLLGGPQAGIIAGKKVLIDLIRRNPLKRAVRADKLTLAGLEATLRLYLDPARLALRLPTLRYMTRGVGEIEAVALKAAELLGPFLGEGYTISVEPGESVVGAGAMPGRHIPTKVIAVSHAAYGPDKIAAMFLSAKTPILGRIYRDRFILDMRTIDDVNDVVPS